MILLNFIHQCKDFEVFSSKCGFHKFAWDEFKQIRQPFFLYFLDYIFFLGSLKKKLLMIYWQFYWMIPEWDPEREDNKDDCRAGPSYTSTTSWSDVWKNTNWPKTTDQTERKRKKRHQQPRQKIKAKHGE